GLLTRGDVFAIDTGCVWGRTLTALRLDDKSVFSVKTNSKDI
ncbi:MAG TPA: diadenosine tetraphosphatase, partial [Methylophilaceae bacterium]|nr:diadenosine tetraphosphatase [Methylophilaceae bacterium]